jgi:hypothetical protein
MALSVGQLVHTNFNMNFCAYGQVNCAAVERFLSDIAPLLS